MSGTKKELEARRALVEPALTGQVLPKACQVREALGLTKTEAGELLLGYQGKQAYDQWNQWETGRRKPSRAADRLLDVMIILAIARDIGRPGVEGALDHVLEVFRKTAGQPDER